MKFEPPLEIEKRTRQTFDSLLAEFALCFHFAALCGQRSNVVAPTVKKQNVAALMSMLRNAIDIENVGLQTPLISLDEVLLTGRFLSQSLSTGEQQ